MNRASIDTATSGAGRVPLEESHTQQPERKKLSEVLALTAVAVSATLDAAREIMGCLDVQYVDAETARNMLDVTVGNAINGTGTCTCCCTGMGVDITGPVNHRTRTSSVGEDDPRMKSSGDIHYSPVIIAGEEVGYIVFVGLKTLPELPSSPTRVDVLCSALARQLAIVMEAYLEVARLSREVDNMRRTRQILFTRDDVLRRNTAEVLHGHVQASILAACQGLREAESRLSSDPGDACSRIIMVRDELDRLREADLRELARDLYPGITVFGMLPALRSLVNKFKSVDPKMDVQIVSDQALERLDFPGASTIHPEVRVGGYRFVEEALANASIHGKATSVTLAARVDDLGCVELEVADNGIGFDPDEAVYGVGFASIDARISYLNGRWSVKSSRGNGTVIVADIPLEIVADDLEKHRWTCGHD